MTAHTELNRIGLADRLNNIRYKIAVIGVAIEGFHDQLDALNGLVDLCADVRDELESISDEIANVEVCHEAA